MSIWYYGEKRNWHYDHATAYERNCLYFRTPIERDKEDEAKVQTYEEMNYGMSDNFTTRAQIVIGICPACGGMLQDLEEENRYMSHGHADENAQTGAHAPCSRTFAG